MATPVSADLFHVPVTALQSATKDLISTLLNPTKVIPTDEGLPRDWRGLAQLVQLPGEVVPMVGSKTDPTAQVLSLWTRGSVGLLQQFLGQLDRWDVVDDTVNLIEKDSLEYVKRQERAQTSATALDANADNQILTVDDVLRLEQGLSPQRYDGFLLFADEDVDFATEIVERMESEHQMKLCVRDRDLVGGLTFEHEAIMRIISERCNRLIVVVSPEFLKSEANKFFVTFAQALGIDQKRRKVVPIVYKRCPLPPDLNYYFVLDYSRSGVLWDFWSKLRDSIHTPSATVRITEAPAMRAITQASNETVSSLHIEELDSEHQMTHSITETMKSSTMPLSKTTLVEIPSQVKSKASTTKTLSSMKSFSSSLENLTSKPGKWFGNLMRRKQSKDKKKVMVALPS